MPTLTLDAARDDFNDHLRARRRTERTRELYRQAITRLDNHLGGDVGVTRITKRDIVSHINTMLDTPGIGAATVALHFRHLRAFFNWLVTEDELTASPMKGLQEPSAPDAPPDVLTDTQLEALLDACKGRDFMARRDTALVMVFADTGIRLGEIHGLELGDWHREHRTLTVTGKGEKTRPVPIGDRATDALAKYVRARRSHAHARLGALWLGLGGPLTASGIAQVLNRRGELAGIGRVHPHQFRHTFAHEWLAAGGSESDLMLLAGWTSPEMVRRYGRAAATDRAIAAHRRFSPLDRRTG